LTQIRRRLLSFAGITLSALLAGCSPVTIADTVLPRDNGIKRVATDVNFGTDPRQRLDVYAPRGAVKPPVVIFIYGGSWASGRRNDYGFIASAFAAKGYVTIVPDYRLVPAVRFPAFIEDGAAAVRWAQDNAAKYGADPKQIFLIGHSAGAYNAMMLGLDQRYLNNAGVDPKSIRGVVGLAGPYDFFPFDVRASIEAFGQAKDPQQTQPINFVRADAPPLLLLTGEADTTVMPRNSKSLAAKMQAAGGQVTLKTYPEIGHAGILLAVNRSFRNRAPVLEDIVRFMQEGQTAVSP
jgi:acetyl esterase/lipase